MHERRFIFNVHDGLGHFARVLEHGVGLPQSSCRKVFSFWTSFALDVLGPQHGGEHCLLPLGEIAEVIYERVARRSGKLSLALGIFGNVCSLEVLHLLPQLRIHLVRDGHNVRKQRTEFQILHVVVQRRKNADLQQSRLLY
jgi:hypothetical protein